jgi:hypothetical protein
MDEWHLHDEAGGGEGALTPQGLQVVCRGIALAPHIALSTLKRMLWKRDEPIELLCRTKQ